MSGYHSTIKKATHQEVLDMCDALYKEELTNNNIASVMRDFDLDPANIEDLSDVMVAVRKILGRTLGKHLEYDCYVFEEEE